jgi:hypothetical protein
MFRSVCNDFADIGIKTRVHSSGDLMLMTAEIMLDFRLLPDR